MWNQTRLMKKTQWKLKKIVFLLCVAESVYVLLYFTSNSHHQNSNNNKKPIRPTSLKPWPILPSYLPWSHNTDIEFRSCEAFFGNGFTHQLDLLSSSSRDDHGWFRCFFSKTLGSSICEGGKVRMVTNKIKMSKGGERLEEVVGRGEEEELPKFQDGAFEVLGAAGDQEGHKRRRLASEEFLNQYVPKGRVVQHTMRELLRSVHVVQNNDFHCDEWIEEPTLLVTRFEYANLFHTITDWYSAYVSSRVSGLPDRPHLVFLDGHCKTLLEQTWKSLFTSVRYAKNFSGSVCFNHAILSPLGYETALFKGLTDDIKCEGGPALNLWENPNDQKTARLSEFGEMITSSFGFSLNNRHPEINSTSGVNILFIRREDYLAHPRHDGKLESRLSNEEEIIHYLQNWASSTSSNHSGCKLNVVNGLFAHMSMKEQVRAVQDANIIIGAHGAGLTHIVSAMPKTTVLEILSSQFRRPHFRLIAKWKGLDYHAIHLRGSYANPTMFIKRLQKILSRLQC